jgi:hypothetical protein
MKKFKQGMLGNLLNISLPYTEKHNGNDQKTHLNSTTNSRWSFSKVSDPNYSLEMPKRPKIERSTIHSTLNNSPKKLPSLSALTTKEKRCFSTGRAKKFKE